jgi:hypothetical protein
MAPWRRGTVDQWGGGHDPAGKRWNVDVWFVYKPERQPDLAHAEQLPPRLTPHTRTAILAIKNAWARRPQYAQR